MLNLTKLNNQNYNGRMTKQHEIKPLTGELLTILKACEDTALSIDEIFIELYHKFNNKIIFSRCQVARELMYLVDHPSMKWLGIRRIVLQTSYKNMYYYDKNITA